MAILIILLSSTVLHSQTSSWKLSDNTDGYATVNSNTGIVTLIKNLGNDLTITATASTTQNNKTVTNTKQILLEAGVSALNKFPIYNPNTNYTCYWYQGGFFNISNEAPYISIFRYGTLHESTYWNTRCVR